MLGKVLPTTKPIPIILWILALRSALPRDFILDGSDEREIFGPQLDVAKVGLA